MSVATLVYLHICKLSRKVMGGVTMAIKGHFHYPQN